jgi:hypothetical protein
VGVEVCGLKIRIGGSGMLIEDAVPRIGAIVTGTDVRSLTEGDWKRLYQTWLDRHVLIVRR